MLFARKFPVRRIENAPRRKRSQPDGETWGERAEFALVIHFGSGGRAKDKMGKAIANIYFSTCSIQLCTLTCVPAKSTHLSLLQAFPHRGTSRDHSDHILDALIC